jgi:hypothetical protein
LNRHWAAFGLCTWSTHGFSLNQGLLGTRGYQGPTVYDQKEIAKWIKERINTELKPTSCKSDNVLLKLGRSSQQGERRHCTQHLGWQK